jgi:hypothetical protein
MNRIQKSSWNPLFTHARPSNIAVFAWLAFLVALSGGWLEGESTFAFCLGLSVGLSFMQIGFNWGQYQSLWFRFFMQNRDTIFKHGYSTKGRALIFLVALAVSKALRVALAFTFLFGQLALLDFLFPDRWSIGLSFISLLAVCFISGFAAHILSRRVEVWGEAKLSELSDYSYIFDLAVEDSSLKEP